MSISYKIIATLVESVKSKLFKNNDSTQSSSSRTDSNTDTDEDTNVIDLQKTFSSENIDVTQIIKDILKLVFISGLELNLVY